MSFPYTENFNDFPEDSFIPRSFTRRDDLTNEIRLSIGATALSAAINKQWGTVTNALNLTAICH